MLEDLGDRRCGPPGEGHSCAKALPSTTTLRDVNRCRVRPHDLIAHQGYTVLVTDVHGRIGQGVEGFYLHQTRFLSRLQIGVDGAAPKFASANVVDHHAITAFHLAPSQTGRAAEPDGEGAGPSGSEVIQKAIELQVNAFTGDGLHLDLILTNHGLATAEIVLSLELEADFADFNEALAQARQQNGLVDRTWEPAPGGGTLRLAYLHPDLKLETRLALEDAGRVVDQGHALACRLTLEPQSPHTITLDLSPHFLGTDYHPFYGRDGAFPEGGVPATARHAWEQGCEQIVADNRVVQSAWDRAVSDLASLQVLQGKDDEPVMLVAGMPNYTGLFGRDAYLTGLQSASLNPTTMRGALQVVTAFNATETDDELDAEPGKVLHQRQLGPLAQLKLSPFLRYYGDQSTPGLFLLSAATLLAHDGDAAFFRSLLPKLRGTLAWMKHNANADGFYPYQTRSSQGVKNQSWKDSGEAVLYPDGGMVKDPIAMADIQALYYAGQQALGVALLSVGETGLGEELLEQAAGLRRRFNEAFWMPDEAYLAMALDPHGRQVRSVGSDAGACLAYGVVDEDKVGAIADRLLSEEMFSGWGIRTLSSRHPAYNPFAYHLGTIWPSPNSVAAFGLRRYGFDNEMFAVAEGLFAASEVFDLNRLPEVFGGHARDARHPHPGLYPGACSPQAWSAGAVILLVNTMLGLTPLAPLKTLVVDPVLPDWLPTIVVRNVQVGNARVSLRVTRNGAETDTEILDAGGARVVLVDRASVRRGEDRVRMRVAVAGEA